MASRAMPQSPNMPAPLEECHPDRRLPEAMRELELDAFAKNKGFNTYGEYMYSQYDRSRGASEKSEGSPGHVEHDHLPGHAAKPK